QIEIWHVIAICMLGLRIVVPSALILILGANTVRALLEAMPEWLTDGLAIGGGMLVAVGFVMVMNMMAIIEVWPFVEHGFVLATICDITLIGLGIIGLSLALIYISLSKMGGSGPGGGGNTGDPVGDIIDSY